MRGWFRILFGLVMLSVGSVASAAEPAIPSLELHAVDLAVAFQVTTIAVRVQWDPNPAAEGVTAYTLSIDGGPNMTILASACTTVCEQPLTVTVGPHSVAVSATNAWGTGPITTVTANTVPPGAPKNLRIIK